MMAKRTCKRSLKTALKNLSMHKKMMITTRVYARIKSQHNSEVLLKKYCVLNPESSPKNREKRTLKPGLGVLNRVQVRPETNTQKAQLNRPICKLSERF